MPIVEANICQCSFFIKKCGASENPHSTEGTILLESASNITLKMLANGTQVVFLTRLSVLEVGPRLAL